MQDQNLMHLEQMLASVEDVISHSGLFLLVPFVPEYLPAIYKSISFHMWAVGGNAQIL